MEEIPSQLQYKSNTLEYYKNIFPWIKDSKLKQFNLKGITSHTTCGILITYKNEYYFLTPLLDLKPFDLKYISATSNIDCDVLFHSAQYKLTLSKLRSKPLEDGIKLENIKKVIPNDDERLVINLKDYYFKKDFLTVIGMINALNLYYYVEKTYDIQKGMAVYYNNNLVGIVINEDSGKILNGLSIMNFLNETIKMNRYSGLFGLYYDYEIKDNITKIKINNNVIYSNIKKNNLYTEDVLLEIDDYKVINNFIEYPSLGNINVYTYILLFHNYDTIIKLKILRNNLEETIYIKPQPLYNNEIISTDLNKFTNYKEKNNNIYYYLNNHIIYELYKLDKFSIENNLQVILNKCNIARNEFFIMKYNKGKNSKKIALKDKIDLINNKLILTLDDL